MTSYLLININEAGPGTNSTLALDIKPAFLFIKYCQEISCIDRVYSYIDRVYSYIDRVYFKICTRNFLS